MPLPFILCCQRVYLHNVSIRANQTVRLIINIISCLRVMMHFTFFAYNGDSNKKCKHKYIQLYNT